MQSFPAVRRVIAAAVTLIILVLIVTVIAKPLNPT